MWRRLVGVIRGRVTSSRLRDFFDGYGWLWHAQRQWRRGPSWLLPVTFFVRVVTDLLGAVYLSQRQFRWVGIRLGAVTMVFFLVLAGTRALQRVGNEHLGTTIVVSGSSTWASGQEWTVPTEPRFRIGSEGERDVPTPFSIVGGVTRLSDGRSVVVDSRADEVRWFDSDGVLLYSNGGSGRGPGEFNFPSSVLRLPGDSVLVEDRPRIKHVFFDPTGGFVREESLDRDLLASIGPWSECRNILLPDRGHVFCKHIGDPPPPDPGPGHYRRFAQQVLVPWDLTGQVRLGRMGGIEQWGVEYEGHTRFAVHPFHSRGFIAVGGAPYRVVSVLNPDYSIDVWRPDGTLERTIRRSNAQRAPTSRESQLASQVLNRYARGDSVLESLFRSEIEVPETLPAVHDLVVDWAGDIWVRTTPVLDLDAPPSYDVFAPDGSLLGEVSMPPRLLPLEIGDDYVLGVATDEFDGFFVAMHDLIKPAG